MGREDMLRHVPPYRETGALDDHAHLRKILRQRIRDRVLLRLIGKWLNAGALEGMTLSYPDEGTPQGRATSPLLANIYLHEEPNE
jgi:RNA-directed DNA polymerase